METTHNGEFIDMRTLSQKQKGIVRLLFNRTYLQNELAHDLGVSPPVLYYHLSQLEDMGLVEKKTIMQLGSAKKNEISLNPLAYQSVREVLGTKSQTLTLITGFGSLGTGYRIPTEATELLHEENMPITRVVCITTPEAFERMKEFESSESLIPLDRVELVEYKDLRNFRSDAYDFVKQIIKDEIIKSDLIIDITPLSKLYSFFLLQLAKEFEVPCFYSGEDIEGNKEIIWLSELELQGNLNAL
jgi:DNA-binding MarR family transcriptional regulator